MVHWRRPLVLVLAIFAWSVAMAESPGSLLKKGAAAEARQDYESAYEYYKTAYASRPGDLKYQVAFERVRFLAAAAKIKRGQMLREQGNLQEALQLFLKATEIDPSNDLARQEILRTQEWIKSPPAREGGEKPAATPSSDSLNEAQAEEPVQLCAISAAPLQALKLSGDVKTIYTTVARIAGINVLFDPELPSRTAAFELRGVTLRQALGILSLQSRTFWYPVTPNTIFVVADNPAKRRELDQSAIQSFYLGHVATPAELQDMVTAIRTILEVQHIQPVPSQNVIVVRGTPGQLALAQKMIDDFDKVRPEVVVDIVVAQVQRDKVRQIGIFPPQTSTLALQNNNSSNSTANNNTTNPLTLNNLQHLDSNNYAFTVDPVQAKFLLTDANTKILEKPQLRAADGVKASLKVGERIPIATGSFGTPVGLTAGAAQLGVNTQFQYTDVGVKIEITPRVQADSEVDLKVSLEISDVSSEQTIGNITQPVISQRTVDHEIQLKDGEMNLLGGILEDQTVLNTSGVPILSRIPLLKYIFGQEDKEKHTDEVVFLLVPHIVRGRFLSALNRKRLDVGPGNNIGLRFSERPVEAGKGAAHDCAVPLAPAASVPSQTAPAAGPVPVTTRSEDPDN
jgi:general secretion pathway protein D